MTLTEHTRQKLIDRPRHRTLDDLAKETGLSPHWLSKFARGAIKCGTADKIELLYNALSESPLEY